MGDYPKKVIAQGKSFFSRVSSKILFNFYYLLFISVTIKCGQTTRENNSYMVLSTSDTPTMPECSYKICGASTDICRIRFDFTKFVIAGPNTGTATTDTKKTENVEDAFDQLFNS